MKASEIAFRAAEVMSQRGHCKNQLENSQGNVCHQGALLVAIRGRAQWSSSWELPVNPEVTALIRAVNRVSEEILEERGYREIGPVAYNNKCDTTGEDVIILLKEAGARLADLHQ